MLLVIMQCEKKAQNFGISKYILYMIISLLPQSRRSRGRVHHSGYHGIGLTSHSATDMGYFFRCGIYLYNQPLPFLSYMSNILIHFLHFLVRPLHPHMVCSCRSSTLFSRVFHCKYFILEFDFHLGA